jgi:O-antigen/teichoic acid export membrane protein
MALNLLGSISLWTYLPKYIIKVKDIKPFRDVKTIIKLFLPAVATQIYMLVDKTMIGYFSEGINYFENGYYEQTEKIIKICLTVVTSLGTVMIPRIARVFKDGNTKQVQEYMYQSYRFTFLASIPICFGLISIASIFVPVFFGPGYEKVETLMIILSFLAIVIGLSNANGYQYFVPTQKENILAITVIIGAVANIALNAVLIPKYFSIGACIASVVGECLITIIGFAYIRKERIFSLRKIAKESINYFISGIVMFIILWIIKPYLSISVTSLAILIILGGVIYLSMLIILKDALIINSIKDFLKNMKNKIKK